MILHKKKPKQATYIHYKISLIARDSTNEAEFVLFEKIGQLIRKPLITLLRANRPLHEPPHETVQAARAESTIPSELAAIISHKYSFVVSVTDRSFIRQIPMFQVHRIATDYSKQLHSSLFPTVPSSHSSSMQQIITQQTNTPLAAIAVTIFSTLHTQVNYMSTIRRQKRFDSSQDAQIPHTVHRKLFPAEPPIESSPTPQITPDEDLDPEAQSQTDAKKRLKPHHLFC